MKSRLQFTSIVIAITVFLLGNAMYALLTFPVLYNDREIWLLSAVYAFLGSAIIGFVPLLILVYRLCERGREMDFRHFHRELLYRSLWCSTGSGLIVFGYFALLLTGWVEPLLIALPLIGMIAPLPVVLALRSPIRKLYFRLYPIR